MEEIVLNNAFLEMIGYMQYSAYFSKFLHSSPNGNQLSQTFAERFATLGPTWDRNISHPPKDRPDGYYESVARTLYSPPSARRLPRRPTRNLSFTRPLGDANSSAARILAHEPDIQEATHRVRRQMKNWNVCSMDKCNKRSNLKACGRCQTVRYCCVDHQRKHWGLKTLPHKNYCYATEY
ncbi:hypothetical protein B0H17DRAFT_236654 [Mycena rosella]|uniref:MYND-type domain-containing protein n=1 Tax=Mycena rosella TaxID=1033263 RepID=A0AAD7H1I1_MYCRO|nr:hypothetical protein B0H17DRAFT_236654 [Mycena rosella]